MKSRENRKDCNIKYQIFRNPILLSWEIQQNTNRNMEERKRSWLVQGLFRSLAAEHHTIFFLFSSLYFLLFFYRLPFCYQKPQTIRREKKKRTTWNGAQRATTSSFIFIDSLSTKMKMSEIGPPSASGRGPGRNNYLFLSYFLWFFKSYGILLDKWKIHILLQFIMSTNLLRSSYFSWPTGCSSFSYSISLFYFGE